MATHHTCDRCGRDCDQHSDHFGGDVRIDEWVGDGSIPQREQPLTVSVKVDPVNLEDDADLCVFCQVDILLALCTVLLDTRKRPVDGTTEAEPTL